MSRKKPRPQSSPSTPLGPGAHPPRPRPLLLALAAILLAAWIAFLVVMAAAT